MHKMERTYKETVAVIETQLIHIESHLQNIDVHMERLNNQEGKQNLAIAKNTVRIGLMWKIGAGLFTLFGGGVAIVLKVIGVY